MDISQSKEEDHGNMERSRKKRKIVRDVSKWGNLGRKIVGEEEEVSQPSSQIEQIEARQLTFSTPPTEGEVNDFVRRAKLTFSKNLFFIKKCGVIKMQSLLPPSIYELVEKTVELEMGYFIMGGAGPMKKKMECLLYSSKAIKEQYFTLRRREMVAYIEVDSVNLYYRKNSYRRTKDHGKQSRTTPVQQINFSWTYFTPQTYKKMYELLVALDEKTLNGYRMYVVY